MQTRDDEISSNVDSKVEVTSCINGGSNGDSKLGAPKPPLKRSRTLHEADTTSRVDKMAAAIKTLIEVSRAPTASPSYSTVT
jgi:predicted chitinase